MRSTYLIALLLAISLIRAASSQCDGRWIGMDSATPPQTVHFGAGIFSRQAVWDPDGAGPQPPWLVIGGNFTGFGAPAANYIVGWDGTTWHNFAGGFTDRVRAMRVYQGQLVAAGLFTQTNSGVPVNHIARWDGATWQPFGSGITGTSYEATIWCMAEMPDGLYVGGVFSSAGGVPAANVARWDGTTWHAVGAGLDGEVDNLLVFQGNLYAAGKFSHSGTTPIAGVARLSGATWQSVGTPAGTQAYALADYAGSLYADLGTATNAINVTISRMNATGWEPLLNLPVVRTMCVADGKLYIGGDPGALSYPAQPNITSQSGGLLMYDGSRFHCLLASSMQAHSGIAYSIIKYGDHLSVSGFNSGDDVDNDSQASMLFSLYNDRWRAFPGHQHADGVVRSIAGFDDRLFVAGSFFQFRDFAANFAAMWDGREWNPIGVELPGPASLRVDNDRLVVSSSKLYRLPDEDTTVSYQYRNGQWTLLQVMSAAPPSGARGTLAVGEQIYAFGSLGTVADNFGSAVQRWNGLFWESLGNSTDYLRPGVSCWGYSCYALVEFNGQLVQAAFAADTNSPDGYLIFQRWDGELWHEVARFNYHPGSLQNYYSTFLASAGGAVWIGGRNPSILRSTDLVNWSTQYLPPSATSGSGGFALCIGTDPRGSVVVGGDWRTGVSRWNGTEFENLNPALSDPNALRIYNVFSVGSHHGELIAGGDFATAGGVEAFHVARWSYNGRVTFSQQPISTSTCNDGSAAFSVLPSSGYGDDTLTYQWTKGGVPLVDGLQSSGSRVAGATTATLTISGITASDAGDYACEVTDACGPATSRAATLTVRRPYARECGGPGCEPDLNADGNVDAGDIAYLINVVAGGENPAAADPDFNQDGNADEGDIDALIGVVAGESCP